MSEGFWAYRLWSTREDVKHIAKLYLRRNPQENRILF